MNEEVMLSNIAGLKLLVVAFIGYWYSLCGRGVINGWLGRRRVILPTILCLSWVVSGLILNRLTGLLLVIIGLSWLMYFMNMSLFSYGAGSWIRKLVGKTAQQFIVGGVHGGSCILVALFLQSYWLLVLSVLLGSVALGILGSVGDGEISAAFKEAVVGACIFLIPVFMI